MEYLKKITGVSPILLLDDVESELDTFRKKALFWKISEIDSQVIITSTDISDENKEVIKGSDIMVIEEGEVKEFKT